MLLGSSSKVPFNTDFTFGPFLFSFNIFARRPHYPMIQYLSPVCRRYQDLLTSVKQNKTDFNCFLDIKILECKDLYPQTASSWTPAGSRAFTETALHWIWSVLSLIKTCPLGVCQYIVISLLGVVRDAAEHTCDHTCQWRWVWSEGETDLNTFNQRGQQCSLGSCKFMCCHWHSI